MKKIQSLLLIATLALAGSAATSWAQVQEVTLRVDGLACPFCAYGVEKKLKSMDGVQSMDVRINEGKVLLQWEPEQPLDLARLYEAVDSAGFTLRGVKGVFSGTLQKDNDRYVLELGGATGQRFYLFEPSSLASKDGAHEHEGTTELLTDSMRAQLDSALQAGARVNVTGPVHDHADANLLGGLGIEQLSMAEDTARP